MTHALWAVLRHLFQVNRAQTVANRCNYPTRLMFTTVTTELTLRLRVAEVLVGVFGIDEWVAVIF